jgi:hypothetical protein
MASRGEQEIACEAKTLKLLMGSSASGHQK